MLGTVLCFVFFFYLSGPYVKTVDDEVQLYTDINSDEDFVPGRPRHGGGGEGGGWRVEGGGGDHAVYCRHMCSCAASCLKPCFFFLSFWT